MKNRIKRFSPVQRIFHLLLMISFMIQSITGLARMYFETNWGKWLCNTLGGYEFALLIHIYVGLFMVFGFLIHALYLISKVDWRKFPKGLFGSDSMLPKPDDIKLFFQHVGWFLGLAKQPRFDRWGYWEKFDFWAVFWGMVIIGITGILMAYPLVSTRYMPGWGLNVAFWVHRIEAILAMAHIFIIHFFIAHFRKHSFPMDRAMFEGTTDYEAALSEKPEWILRLKNEDRLSRLMTPEAGANRRIVYFIVGYSMVAIGFFLLVGAIMNAPSITW